MARKHNIQLRVNDEEMAVIEFLKKHYYRPDNAGLLRFLVTKEYEEVVQDHIEKTYRENSTVHALVVRAIITAYKFNKANPLVVCKLDERVCISIAAVAKIANKISEGNGHAGGLMTAHRVGVIARGELNLETTQRTKSGFHIKYNKIRMEGLALHFGIDPDALEPVVI